MEACYVVLPHLLPLGAVRCVFDSDAFRFEVATDGIGGSKIAAGARLFALRQSARDQCFQLWVDGGLIGDYVEHAIDGRERGAGAFERGLIRTLRLVELAIGSTDEVEQSGDGLGRVEVVEQCGLCVAFERISGFGESWRSALSRGEPSGEFAAPAHSALGGVDYLLPEVDLLAIAEREHEVAECCGAD